jgi:hypothetical protein
MSRETLKSFLNSKSLPTDSISYKYDTDGPASREAQVDIGTDAFSGKDLLALEEEGQGLLGDYLSYIVENADQVFGIAPGNELAAPSNRGESLVLAEEQGAEEVFVSQGTDLANNLDNYSNGKYFESAGVELGSLLDKTGKSGNSHNLLSDIEGKSIESYGATLASQNGDSNKVVKATHSVLKDNNRFANTSNKTAFATSGISNKKFESDSSEEGTILAQRKFGHFTNTEGQFSIESLKSVGASMLYKASGYDAGRQPGKSMSIKNLEKGIASNEIESSQIAGDAFNEVEFRNTRAKYAAGSPEDDQGNSLRDGKGEFLDGDPDADSSRTFGSTYNPSVPFSGANRKVLKLKAAVACLALSKVTFDFVDQITTMIRFSDLEKIQDSTGDFVTKDKRYDGPGPYLMGAYNQLNSFDLDVFKKLVLVRTDYPYPECFEKGIEVFFGAGVKKDSVDEIKKHEHISQAPGYWLSIASSILKSYDSLLGAFSSMESFESDSGESLSILYEIIKSNKLVQFANSAATVGDIFFKTNGGLKKSSMTIRRPFDVDSLPSTPATRVGKSRDTGSESPLNLAWRQGSVPSMYLLPRNVVKATVDLNNIVDGANPARGMLATNLVKNTYLDREHSKSYNRIPNDVVKRLEDRLEAEYVPFYIQDLRTNEIISFHAFLSSLSDSIKPTYTAVDGYGRMDPVQVYKSTTRSVSVKFVLYATSKEDFDSMWYKINKLVTLLYPQWTQGTMLSSVGLDRFVQPFSQVLGASPIVRLRVGDVIKSNYSRFNLSRIFGIGDEGINPILGDANGGVIENLKKTVEAGVGKGMGTLSGFMTEIFYGVMGTPLQYIPSTTKTNNRAGNLGLRIARNSLSNILINGFVNPIGGGLVLRNLIDPNSKSVASAKTWTTLGAVQEGANSLMNTMADNNTLGYHTPQRVLIKSNMVRGYRVAGGDWGKRVFIDRPIQGMVMKKLEYETVKSARNGLTGNNNFKSTQTRDNVANRTRYQIFVLDPSADRDLMFKMIEVDHQYLMPDPRDIFMTTAGLLLGIAQPRSFLDYLASFLNDASSALGVGTELVDLVTDLYATQPEKFMQPENNPFTRALEATSGRGLAGVMDGITFNWLDPSFTWETDYNSRAPKGVEIGFNFNVIHDLPPGLDHSGYNRAPLYNVGTVMKEVQGDARNDDSGAEFEYKRAGAGTTMKSGQDT